MELSIFDVVLLIGIIIIGIYSSITDYKDYKIYNKAIFIIASIGIFIQVINIVCLLNKNIIDYNFIKLYIGGITVGILLPFLIYANGIWAAGDSKLITLLIILFPIDFMVNRTNLYFVQFNTILFVFSLGYIFILIETIILLIKDIYYKKIRFYNIKKYVCSINNTIKSFLFKYIISCLLILNMDRIYRLLLKDFYYNNKYVFVILNIIVIFMIYKHIRNQKILKLMIPILLIIYLISNIKYDIHIAFDLKYLLLILLIVVLRQIGNLYNYKEISTEELKEGMILSLFTVNKFQISRVKGLPLITDESTKYRLSDIEVDAIKRWSNSKYGEKSVTIVKHIPFAPFIFFGYIVELILIAFF